MSEITFERLILYDEVWTTPLTKLGEKYGLSDNGLRKICKVLSIPLPSARHWAKIAAGHVVPRASLPKNPKQTRFVSRGVVVPSSFSTPEDEQWLLERIAFEELEANRLSLDSPPVRWHKAVVPLRNALRIAIREAEVARRDAERAEKYPQRRHEPNWSGWSWGSFRDRGQILLHTHKSSPARVSPLTQERAVAIFNALSRAAEDRGFAVSMNDDRGRLIFDGHGGELELRISERLDDKFRTEKNSWDNKSRAVEYKEPTGKLRLFIGWRVSAAEVADVGDHPIESQLNDVFIKCYRLVIRQREDRRKSEAREREWQAQLAVRRAEAASLQAAEDRRVEELRRRRALLVEAKNWKSATLIREYVGQISTTAEVDGKAEASIWKEWAVTVAQSLDPTVARQKALRSLGGSLVVVRSGPHSDEDGQK